MSERADSYLPILNKLQKKNQLRQIPRLEHGTDLIFVHKGQEILNLASNNYLGLANHPSLKAMAQTAIAEYGCSSGGSRLTSGGFHLLDELEAQIRAFHGRDAALVLNSGYAANLAMCTALANRQSIIFSDKLNHASILDGILLSRAKQVRYRHNDMDHLRFCLKKYRQSEHKLLITDSVFSMDGDLADLTTLVKICKEHNTLLLVDEAHATGIYGQGRGLSHELGIEKEVDILMGTFSKALGSQGGYLCAATPIIDMVINAGRPYIFSTAPPPAMVGANMAALHYIATHPELGTQNLNLAQKIRDLLSQYGFSTGNSVSHIIPLILGSNENVLQGQQFLFQKNIFTAAVRPPAVPEGTARLRLAVRADMQKEHLNLLSRSIAALSRQQKKT